MWFYKLDAMFISFFMLITFALHFSNKKGAANATPYIL